MREGIVEVNVSLELIMKLLQDNIVEYRGILDVADMPVAAHSDNSRGIVSIICTATDNKRTGEGGELRSCFHVISELKK